MPKNSILTTARIAADALGVAFDRLTPTPRQKLAGGVAAVLLTSVVGAIATVDGKVEPVVTRPVLEQVGIEPVALGDPGDSLFWYEETFGRGDTFGSLLGRMQVRSMEAARVVADAQAGRVLRKLRTGVRVRAQVSRTGDLERLEFVTPEDRLAILARGTTQGSGLWRVTEQPLQLSREVVSHDVTVRSRAGADIEAAGVPASVTQQLSQAFHGSISVPAGLVRGDRLSVLYETFHHDGELVRTGRVLAAEFVRGKQVRRTIWFESGSTRGYFDPASPAQAMVAAPARPAAPAAAHSHAPAGFAQPLDVTRVTSGFAARLDSRRHRWVAHKGIDLGAPIGTPVRATAEGVVDYAGWQSGYGNVVVVRHPGDYTTLYAHLSQFSPTARSGLRIGQGDVLGFVGMTGWATGPHLHYELRRNGAFINPLSASAAPAAAAPEATVAAAPVMIDNGGLPARVHAQMQARARELFAQIDTSRQAGSTVALLD
jgi:hypothetical protein